MSVKFNVFSQTVILLTIAHPTVQKTMPSKLVAIVLEWPITSLLTYTYAILACLSAGSLSTSPLDPPI